MAKEAIRDLNSFVGHEGFKINDARVLTAQEHSAMNCLTRDHEVQPFRTTRIHTGHQGPESSHSMSLQELMPVLKTK